MSRKQFLKSGGVLTLGNGISALSSFLRNIIIARLISVEDFGMASLFALAMSAAEMASYLAVDKIIIQDKNGDNERFQSSGHAFLVIRGLFSGLVLFLVAKYVAQFFNIPQATWAFQVLAIIPIIKGFLHLDVARFQRDMNFFPVVMAETLPQVVILLISIPLALWLHNYEVVVWLILIQTIAHVLLSHVFAKRKYKIGWNNNDIARMYKFGWPLLVNGVVMFAILQGDKAIVGKAYSMEILGWYSAAFVLTLAPAMIITKVIYSLMLPWLSRSTMDMNVFNDRSILAINYCLMTGLILSIVFSIFGSELITILFGVEYNDGKKVVALLAFMQFIRIAKSGSMIVAMSIGDTKNPMISNLSRAFSFLVAVLFAWQGSDIITIVIIGLLGELSAFFVSTGLLLRKIKIKLIDYYQPAVISFIAAFCVMQFGSTIFSNESYVLNKTAVVILSIITLFISLQLMPRLKNNLKDIIFNKVS